MLNPSAIDLSALPWLPLDARSAFPRQPAIYFAIDQKARRKPLASSYGDKPGTRF